MERGFLGLQWKDSCHQKNKNAFNDSGRQLGFLKDLAYTLTKPANNYQEEISSIQRTRTSLHDAINSPLSSFPPFALPSPPVLIPKKKSTWNFPFMFESVPLLGTSNNDLRPSNSGGQLTIFYANDVYVYEDVTPHQMEAIMELANSGSGKKKQPAENEEHQTKKQCPDPNPAATSRSQQTSRATVPQARKATLERFLHKRKNRLNKWVPYNSMQKKPSLCFNVDIDLESFPTQHEC